LTLGTTQEVDAVISEQQRSLQHQEQAAAGLRARLERLRAAEPALAREASDERALLLAQMGGFDAASSGSASTSSSGGGSGFDSGSSLGDDLEQLGKPLACRAGCCAGRRLQGASAAAGA
jgi:septal ring factor EnvC (AmiA/AmiB activator)